MSLPRDFVKELRNIIKNVDQKIPVFPITEQKSKELYAIHKRRLVRDQDPCQQLNQRILWNLSLIEANWWKNKLKAKIIDDENTVVEYYEKVNQNGKFAGILDNEYDENNIIKECGTNDSETTEPDWKG